MLNVKISSWEKKFCRRFVNKPVVVDLQRPHSPRKLHGHLGEEREPIYMCTRSKPGIAGGIHIGSSKRGFERWNRWAED